MVRSLQDALDQISKLSPQQQEEFASFITEELSADKRWADLLSGSETQLAALAEEALAEHRRGETKPFRADGDLPDH